MRRGAWADDLAGLRAASWDFVISVAELVRLGVPERTVYRRCQEGGPWTLLLPGVVLLATGEATLHQRRIAALPHRGRTPWGVRGRGGWGWLEGEGGAVGGRGGGGRRMGFRVVPRVTFPSDLEGRLVGIADFS